MNAAEWILGRLRDTPNRGVEHVFLGDPMSDGCDKTTVEPGNVYSPGVWTCGVSVCVCVGDEVVSPELVDQDGISWGFEQEHGFAPVLVSRWEARPGLRVTHRLCHLGCEGTQGVDFSEVCVESESELEATLGVLVRDVGPAGGKISKLEWDGGSRTLTINDAGQLVVEGEVDGCTVAPVDDAHDSPAAVVVKKVRLAPQCPAAVRFRTAHNGLGRFWGDVVPCDGPHLSLGVENALEQSRETWHRCVPAQVFAPDPRIARAWDACALHILAAMECGLPRIGAVNYPVFWTRDCIIVLRALDLMGRHDLAHIGCDYLASHLFLGGFGAESDGPGQSVWSMVSHATIADQTGWLTENFGIIRRRMDLVERMLSAEQPIHAVTDNRVQRILHTPGGTVLCLPSANGLIHGRMDMHSPDFFINCWASAGLKHGAVAAHAAGHDDLAATWNERSLEVDEAIAVHLLPTYGNPRDPIIAPYPSGALDSRREALTQAFRAWYVDNRIDEQGNRSPDPEWTYFEAAQIHNAFLLGLRSEAWACLDGMLGQSPGRDVYAYVEGSASGAELLPFRNDLGACGWLSRSDAKGGNMPHNWTGAEMVNLIRDMFVREEGETLVLGLGVPATWLRPGAEFGVRDMPSDLGTVSYTVRVGDGGKWGIEYDGPADYRVALPAESRSSG